MSRLLLSDGARDGDHVVEIGGEGDASEHQKLLLPPRRVCRGAVSEPCQRVGVVLPAACERGERLRERDKT
eukprot:763677-Hanusia_phi.AAC.1